MNVLSEAFEPTSMSLLQRARSNDQEAWNRLVQLYGPLVYRWCRRSNLNEDDTADVFQETFRSVSSNLEKFSPQRETGSFRSWLRSIVRSKVVDHFRAANKNPKALGGTDAQMHLASVPDPLAEDSEDEEANDQSLLVLRAMDMIKPEFTERNWIAFQKVALQGFSAPEVAKEFGISDQAVRQANYRIRRRLRIELRDLVEDV